MSLSSAPASAALEGDAALIAAAAALRQARARRTRRRLGVVALVLAAAIGFLLYKALTSGVVYFKTVAQAVAARKSLGNATFQIEGVVAPHTLHVAGVHQAFALCAGPVRIPVHNVGTPPQLFTSGVAVVLVGHFVGTSNLFSSNEILIKHSSSYVAAHPGRVQHGDNQHC